MLSRFHPIPELYGRTDRQTDIDRQTDLLYQYCASVCWRVIKIGQVWHPIAPQPNVVQKSRPDPGNSLALGLQPEVTSISLQCIPWPVACSEWGACLTEFDRSSTCRFSGSGIRTMIRIGLKSWSVRPCPDTYPAMQRPSVQFDFDNFGRQSNNFIYALSVQTTCIKVISIF